jgi:hypothetical protein
MIFQSCTSSANFAINAAEGNPIHLARMFTGMSETTAVNVLANLKRVRRIARDKIDVPNDLVV